MTVLEAIENFFKGRWEYEIEKNEKTTVFYIKHLTLGSLDDDLQISVAYSTDELMSVFFTFDKIEKTTDVCYFLEGINEQSHILTACINTEGFFELRARAITLTNGEDAGFFLSVVFDELQGLEKNLSYITELTN